MSPAAAFRAVRRGITSDTAVVVVVMMLQNVLRIVSSMILTRLLNAEAFAIVGIITSVMVTFALISDVGIIAFIVRHERGADREFRDEVWTLRLIRGIALSVLILLLAGPIAKFMMKPELQWPIAVAGLTSLIDGLGSMAPFSALRARRVKLMSAIDVGSQIVGLLISIICALIFRSFWAIILSTLLGQLMGLGVGYWLYPDSGQRFRLSRVRAAELWQFSRFITGSTMLTLVITQGDKLVLARAFPLDVMGIYVIAAGLAIAPVGLATAYAGRVLYPLYAEIFRESPDELRRKFYSVRMPQTLFYCFATGGFIGSAHLVITLLYDPRYIGAAVYLPILAISTFFAAGNYAANEVMIAVGNSRFTFVTNLGRLGYLAVAGSIGWWQLGPLGIVWAVGTVELAAQIVAWVTLKRYGFLSVRRELLFILTGLAGAAVGYGGEQLIMALFHIQ
jgi:O-antigen/teichoic acid export membrane protein